MAAMENTTSDPCRMSAGALASAIAKGQLSAVEAVEAHIAQIEKVNPKLNAVVVKRYDAARNEAREADRKRAAGEPLGPLHGVPVTIKECIDVAGTPSTFGLEKRADVLATRDEVHVARVRNAGAIVLGKTNAGQLLLMLEASNPVYGQTNNPWSLARSPGGSSGGEGAIIAAHASPLGLGTDLGGSCRIPAAFCGIAGFKPTAGRTPDLGRYSVPLGQQGIASQVGVLARTASDIALGLSVINGPTGLNPFVPLGDYRQVDVSKLRVACFSDDGTFAPSPCVKRGVDEAAQILKSAGARVEPWQPPKMAHAADLYFGFLTADRGRGIMEFLRGQKRDPKLAALLFMMQRSHRTLVVLRALLRLFGQKGLVRNIRAFGYGDTLHYWRLVEAQMEYRAQFLAALDKDGQPFDAILCPQSPLVAFTHGASANLGIPGSYSQLANLLGFPAGVVPVTRVKPGEETRRRSSIDGVQKTASQVEKESAGLPVGVQVIARPWQDHVALAVMATIENATSARGDFPAEPPLA
ncbi:MAG: amidase [Proteobacteria bacterium]|nr:amidase [Pseudomonadota bacterium]